MHLKVTFYLNSAKNIRTLSPDTFPSINKVSIETMPDPQKVAPQKRNVGSEGGAVSYGAWQHNS
jgi:hypothetical protein